MYGEFLDFEEIGQLLFQTLQPSEKRMFAKTLSATSVLLPEYDDKEEALMALLEGKVNLTGLDQKITRGIVGTRGQLDLAHVPCYEVQSQTIAR